MSEFSKQYREKLLPGQKHAFADTDPEFVQIFESFAFDEVVNQGDLDDRTRFMAILAALLGCQGVDEFKVMLPAALNMGVTPVEVKEIVYQSAAYLGIGRVFPFLKAVNEELTARGVSLPLPGQATTTQENRLERGAQLQAEIFGAQLLEAWKNGPVNRWLAANCFGDFYTRTGLDLRQRELITLCFLAAQGGCEPQLTAHIKGNLALGASPEQLSAALYACLPYIGYPRTLNALSCLRQAAEDAE